MRGIDELDHFELLEIGRDASPNQIDRAYRVAQQTFADGSLALYSVFESRDAAAIRERLDEAYRVLSDPELRAEYEKQVPAVAHVEAGRSAARNGRPAIAGGATGQSGVAGAHLQGEIGDDSGIAAAVSDGRLESASRGVDFDSVEHAVEEFDAIEDDGRGEFDGVRLRRNRLFRGYEIDDITEVTKVSAAHLRNIEEENFDDLPADVYVRGFVTAYARMIGLDPKIVVPSYMARVSRSRGGSQRGGFLARR